MKDMFIDRTERSREIRRRRIRQLRRQKMIFLLCSGIFTALICIMLFVNFTFAKSVDPGNGRVKQFKAITIYCGDTRESIAGIYATDEWDNINSYIHELEMINHLDRDEKLIAGNYLIVPYYTETPANTP